MGKIKAVAICSGFFILFFVLIIPQNFAAEAGARPISMGGAFVGLANDAHSASWNPAGMAWQEEQEVTYTGIVNERDDFTTADFISDDYLAYLQPLKGGYRKNFKIYGAIGIFIQHCGYKYSGSTVRLIQPGIAYGKEVHENVALGASVNYYYFDGSVSGASSSDSVFGLNLGFLWNVSDKLAFGCVVENVNEPSYALFGVDNKLVRMVRPGIAYYLSDNTVITCDIYDLFGNTSDRTSDFSQDIRLGIEHYLTDDIAIRFGAHQPNSAVDASKYYSFGIGWQRSEFMGVYPVTYYLDYALAYWQDAPAGMGDYTHQVGVSFKF